MQPDPQPLDTSPPSPELPARVRWFMPWRWFAHWKPWKRWTLAAVVMLAGYIESPIMMDVLFVSTGKHPTDYWIARILIEPLMIVHRNTTAGRWFYDGQAKFVLSFHQPEPDDV